jgi:hypothetical protein
VVTGGVWVVDESAVRVLVEAASALLQPNHLNALAVLHRSLCQLGVISEGWLTRSALVRGLISLKAMFYIFI